MRKVWATWGNRPIISLLVVGVFVLAGAITLGKDKPTQAAPYLGCSPSGYIVKDNTNNTDITAVDMVSGQGTTQDPVPGRRLNAIGYNPKDNHFYAWDLENGEFVKATSDFKTVTSFASSGDIVGYSGTKTAVFSGDVDTDGHYWFFVGTTWYEADLNSGTPTLVGSGTPTNPTGSNGTDWAFVPGTNKLYRAMDEGGIANIWSFDRSSKTYALVGTVPNINTSGTTNDGDMGSVYADPDMNFYMSSNHSGRLFRINLNDTPPFTATTLQASVPGSNDGARCALATVPIDLGDAPSTYSTLIGDPSNGGARHSVTGFNLTASTSSLMLGNNVDIETDGFPTTGADGDDNDHQGTSFVDDERGVAPIVATPGTTNQLTIPVRVANTSGQAATLVGWIDLDNDGAFETGERMAASVASGFAGYKQLTFPAPAAPYSANTYARFRLFSASDTSQAAVSQLPTGPATGGEVEDVLVQVGSYDVSKTANPAEGSTIDPGQTVTYTLTIKNTGSTALNNLKIDDDLSDVLDDATIEGTPTVSPSSAGSASVNGSLLEFAGDIGVGGTVTVNYKVKIKEGGSLGNAALNNFVLAAHSTSCHPQVNGSGDATVSDPDCGTNHKVNALADTGSNILLPLIGAGGLIAAAGAALYFTRKRLIPHKK